MGEQDQPELPGWKIREVVLVLEQPGVREIRLFFYVVGISFRSEIFEGKLPLQLKRKIVPAELAEVIVGLGEEFGIGLLQLQFNSDLPEAPLGRTVRFTGDLMRDITE